MWLKIWRDSSAMAGTPYYCEYEEEEQIDTILDYYDEKIYDDGLHDLKWEKINKPPIEWLELELKKYDNQLKSLYPIYKRSLNNLKKIITKYKEKIENY